MKSVRFVCLIALSLCMTVAIQAGAQTPAMTKGVSVKMAETKNAVPYPDADERDAWIITIIADGRIYFGVKPVTSDELAEQMKSTPRRRDQNLYIKADASTTFSSVESALQIGRDIGFSSPVLLTKQPEVPALGKLVAPKGLEVSTADSAPDAPVLQLTKSGQSGPDVQLNNQDVHLADLQQALNQALQSQKDRIVVVKAHGQLPFAQVVQVIDACASVKAKVVIPSEL